MPAGGLVTAGVGAAGTLIYGAIKESKAKKQQAALNASRPKYTIPQSEADIQNLAESRANQGMGAGARQQLQNNSDRALATGTNAALMGGADPNTIGNIVDKSQNAYGQNAIYDDQVRLKNLDNLQNAWARNTANQDKAWDINTNQPWKDDKTANSQQIQAANNTINSGISQLGSAAAGAAKYGAQSGGGGGIGGGYSPTPMNAPVDGPVQMPAYAPPPQQMQPVQVPDYTASYWGGN